MTYLILGVLALVVDNLLMAYCLRFIGVFPLALLWFAFAAIIGWIYSYIRGCSLNDFKPFFQHPIQSFFYFALSVFGIIFWELAVIKVGVGASSMLMQIGILFNIAFDVIFLKERFKKIELLAGFLLLFGIAIFSYNGKIDFQLNLLYPMLAMLCYTGQAILSKTLVKKVTHNVTVSLRATIVSISMLVFMLFSPTEPIPSISLWLFILIFIGGVSGVFLNKYFTFKSLKEMSLSKFTLITNIQPVIIFILAILLLNEDATLLKAIGAICITVGALVLGREHTKEKQELIS